LSCDSKAEDVLRYSTPKALELSLNKTTGWKLFEGDDEEEVEDS